MYCRRALLVILSLVLLGTQGALAEDSASNFPPEPEEDWYVLDVGDVLSNEVEQRWEASLLESHRETGMLVRLVTIASMCDHDQRMERDSGSRMCHQEWTFDDCYECGWDTTYGEDDSYAARMFRMYGMNATDEPSMLIGVSVEDRRFRYVMPDHSVSDQRLSQAVFDRESNLLSQAADNGKDVDLWEQALAPHVAFGLAVAAGETAPLSPLIVGLLLALVLTSLVVVFRFGAFWTGSQYQRAEAARYRMALSSYRDRLAIIIGKYTLDGNFAQLEVANAQLASVEAMIETWDAIAKGGNMDDGGVYESARSMFVELDQRFHDMFATATKNTLDELQTTSGVQPLDHASDIEAMHDRADLFNTYWSKAMVPWVLGVAALAFIVAVSLQQEGLLLFAMSRYHVFQVLSGSAMLTNLAVLAAAVVLAWRVPHAARNAAQMDGVPPRGTRHLDHHMLGWTTFGVALASGYSADLVGHDEYGSPIYETHRFVSSDGGGGGGGGCGGGGCGGGGCGGGGGF